MSSIGKDFSLLLVVILAVSSLILVESAFAQSIPKPSVPEFTVKLIDTSYNTPATSTIDPYTGETITHPSQRIEARTIEIRIKNVQFTPFEIKNGSNTYTVNFQYNIRFKGHFEEEWRYPYNPNVNNYIGRDSGVETIISHQGEYSSTEGLKLTPDRGGFYATFPPNAKIDFQVQAMIGYIHFVVVPGPFSGMVFEGQTSDWSNTQTITIGETSTSNSPSPTPQTSNPTPTTPYLPPNDRNAPHLDPTFYLLPISVIVAVIAIAIIIYRRMKINK
jgi:hypothetical protein